MQSGNTFAAGERLPRVFVVDDEAIISTTLAAILKMSGYDATSFTHPVEALEASRLTAPDLLLSDVMMPGLSGIDLAIQLGLHCPSCKIILISGQYGTSNLLEGAEKQGHHFEVLPKPLHPSDLLKLLKSTFTSPLPA